MSSFVFFKRSLNTSQCARLSKHLLILGGIHIHLLRKSLCTKFHHSPLKILMHIYESGFEG